MMPFDCFTPSYNAWLQWRDWARTLKDNPRSLFAEQCCRKFQTDYILLSILEHAKEKSR